MATFGFVTFKSYSRRSVQTALQGHDKNQSSNYQENHYFLENFMGKHAFKEL